MGEFFHHEHTYLNEYELQLVENYKPETDLRDEEGLKVDSWISMSFNFNGNICFEPGQILAVKKLCKKKAILLVRFERYEGETDWECTFNVGDFEGGFYHQPTKEGLWRIAVPKIAEDEE